MAVGCHLICGFVDERTNVRLDLSFLLGVAVEVFHIVLDGFYCFFSLYSADLSCSLYSLTSIWISSLRSDCFLEGEVTCWSCLLILLLLLARFYFSRSVWLLFNRFEVLSGALFYSTKYLLVDMFQDIVNSQWYQEILSVNSR